MTEVRFVDTSVLCDLLGVAGKCQQTDAVKEEMKELLAAGATLVLPIASVIETGNHIAQAGDGNARRECAKRFEAVLRLTLAGESPWILHAAAWSEELLEMLCDGVPNAGTFVDLAGQGRLGAGDLSILAERDLYSKRTAIKNVTVWTHDAELAALGG